MFLLSLCAIRPFAGASLLLCLAGGGFSRCALGFGGCCFHQFHALLVGQFAGFIVQIFGQFVVFAVVSEVWTELAVYHFELRVFGKRLQVLLLFLHTFLLDKGHRRF